MADNSGGEVVDPKVESPEETSENVGDGSEVTPNAEIQDKNEEGNALAAVEATEEGSEEQVVETTEDEKEEHVVETAEDEKEEHVVEAAEDEAEEQVIEAAEQEKEEPVVEAAEQEKEEPVVEAAEQDKEEPVVEATEEDKEEQVAEAPDNGVSANIKVEETEKEQNDLEEEVAAKPGNDAEDSKAEETGEETSETKLVEEHATPAENREDVVVEVAPEERANIENVEVVENTEASVESSIGAAEAAVTDAAPAPEVVKQLGEENSSVEEENKVEAETSSVETTRQEEVESKEDETVEPKVNDATDSEEKAAKEVEEMVEEEPQLVSEEREVEVVRDENIGVEPDPVSGEGDVVSGSEPVTREEKVGEETKCEEKVGEETKCEEKVAKSETTTPATGQESESAIEGTDAATTEMVNSEPPTDVARVVEEEQLEEESKSEVTKPAPEESSNEDRHLDQRKKQSQDPQEMEVNEKARMAKLFQTFGSGLIHVYKRYCVAIPSGNATTFQDISKGGDTLDFVKFSRLCLDFGIVHKKGLSTATLKQLFLKVSKRGKDYKFIGFKQFTDLLVDCANELLSREPWVDRYKTSSDRVRALFYRMDLSEERRPQLNKRMLAFGGFSGGDGKLGGHMDVDLGPLQLTEFSKFKYKTEDAELVDTFKKLGDPHTPVATRRPRVQSKKNKHGVWGAAQPSRKPISKNPNVLKQQFIKPSSELQQELDRKGLEIKNEFHLDPANEQSLINSLGLEMESEVSEQRAYGLYGKEQVGLWTEEFVDDIDPSAFFRGKNMYHQQLPDFATADEQLRPVIPIFDEQKSIRIKPKERPVAREPSAVRRPGKQVKPRAPEKPRVKPSYQSGKPSRPIRKRAVAAKPVKSKPIQPVGSTKKRSHQTGTGAGTHQQKRLPATNDHYQRQRPPPPQQQQYQYQQQYQQPAYYSPPYQQMQNSYLQQYQFGHHQMPPMQHHQHQQHMPQMYQHPGVHHPMQQHQFVGGPNAVFYPGPTSFAPQQLSYPEGSYHQQQQQNYYHPY